MASVDDIDELIETRKLNGVDDGLYESDKNVASDKDYTLAYLKDYADAEEKYKNRIKELEEPKIIQDKNIRNGKPIIKGTRLTVIDVLLFIANFIKDHEKEFRENYADISLKQIIDSINYLLNNSIPKQKVKDKIDEINKKYEDSKDENGESPYYYPEYTIKVLEKLLEEK